MADAPKTEMLDVSKLTGDTLEVTLVVTVPSGAEKRYPMRANAMMAGRSDQADIAIKDPSVSSRHCSFEKQGGRLFVKDLGSSNGTFMHGNRITESELVDGDQLRLGNQAIVTVQFHGGAAQRKPAAPPPPADGAGSTMMISANDLDAMRAPPPPRRQALQAAPPSDGRNKKMGLIVGIAAGVTLVLGIVIVLVVMKINARKADLKLVQDIQEDVTKLSAQTPCTAVQDSVGTVIRLEQTAGVTAPVLPPTPKLRDGYQKFVDVQRDKARQFKRIVGTVEQFVQTAQVSLERVKSDVTKIGNESLKAKAAEVATALEERMALGQDFIGGWRKLQGETDRYADLVEGTFIRGGPDTEFGAFRFSKQAPQVLNACKMSHETSKKSLEEKLAALQALAK